MLSKSRTWKAIVLSINAGYGLTRGASGDYLKGLFGGVQVAWKQLYGTVEYDTQQLNLGIGYSFKERLFLNFAAINGRHFSGNCGFRFSL